MLGDEIGVGAAEELTGHREPAEPLGFFDARLLQQVQRTAAGADEHELRMHGQLLPGPAVTDLHDPAAVGLLGQIGDRMAEVDVGALGDMIEELLGERAEIDVGALVEPVQRDRIREVASLRHQRQSCGELGRVVDELHALEQGLGREIVVALAEVLLAFGAVGEGDVRDGVDELRRVTEDAVVDGVGPELARHLELLVDGERLVDVDVAVGGLRRVVQLAECRVSGAGVVPRVAALGGGGVELLEQADRPVGLKLSEQRSERRTHDSRTHQRDVGRDHRFRHLDSTSPGGTL